MAVEGRGVSSTVLGDVGRVFLKFIFVKMEREHAHSVSSSTRTSCISKFTAKKLNSIEQLAQTSTRSRPSSFDFPFFFQLLPFPSVLPPPHQQNSTFQTIFSERS